MVYSQPPRSMSTGWGVKAGAMVRVWVAGKTVWSHCYIWATSEHVRHKGLKTKRYISWSSVLHTERETKNIMRLAANCRQRQKSNQGAQTNQDQHWNMCVRVCECMAYQDVDIFMKVLARCTERLGRRKLKIPEFVLHSNNKQNSQSISFTYSAQQPLL